MINNDQEELVVDIKVTKPGNSVILIEYITLPEHENGAYVTATVRSESSEDSSKVYFNACPYTSACRQVLLDGSGRVKMVKINDSFVGISIKVRLKIQKRTSIYLTLYCFLNHFFFM